MQENVRKRVKDAKRKRSRRRKFYVLIACCSVLVAGIVSWRLMMPGNALSETYCGKEEHIHSAACSQKVLTCGQAESAGHVHGEGCYTTQKVLACGQEEGAGAHTHTEACYDGEGNLICGQDESAGHIHTDACYAEQKTLTCGQAESAGHTHTDACYTTEQVCGMEEHTHTAACHSNPEDVETEDQWTEDFADYELTGEWGTDAAAIAKTQVGYKESTGNYRVNEDESADGYTRYADWAGDDIYGDWDTYFAAFVLNYAGVPTDKFPVNANDLNQWITDMSNSGYYAGADSEDIEAGDLVILKKQDQDRDQQIGVISEVKTDSDDNVTSIKVVEGNVDNAVVENEYSADSSDIVGYGLVSKAYAAAMGEDSGVSIPSLMTASNVLAASNSNDNEQGEGNGDAAVRTDEAYDLSTSNRVSFTFSDYSLEVGSEFSGTLSFTLNVADLNGKNKLTYKMPTEITLVENLNGIMDNGYGSTYEITKDGYINITLSSEFLERSAEDGLIDGMVAFEGTVSSYPDKGEIIFPGGSGTISVKRDMTLSKSQPTKKDDDTWHYVITVSSESGTGQDIQVKDEITLSDNTAHVEYANLTVKKNPGDINVPVGNSFPLTLNELQAKESYTIEYDVNLTQSGVSADGLKVTNKATAVSGEGEHELTGEASQDTTFIEKRLEKTGSYNELTNQIEWTITISNPSGSDLEGQKVEDTFKNTEMKYVEGSFSISPKPSPDGTFTKTDNGFTYTFPEGSDETRYTIKYSTDVGKSIGVFNNGVSFGGGDTEGSVTVGEHRKYNYVKLQNGVADTENANIKKVTWHVDVTLPADEVYGELTYTDTIKDAVLTTDNNDETLEDTHYTTVKDVVDGIQNSMVLYNASNAYWSQDYIYAKEGYELTITCYDKNNQVVTDPGARVQSFKVNIKADDGSIDGIRITFTYDTYADISGIEDVEEGKLTFKNILEDKSAEYVYEKKPTEETPDLYKEAVRIWNWSQGNAEALPEGEPVSYDNTNGVLYYRIVIQKGDNMPYTLTDTLSDGMSFVQNENGNLDIVVTYYNSPTDYWPGDNGNNNTYARNLVEVSPISTDQDENGEEHESVSFIVHKQTDTTHWPDGYKGMQILYGVKIDDAESWADAEITREETDTGTTIYNKTYVNTVEWEGKVIETSTEVTREWEGFEKAGEFSDDHMTASYSVIINANAMNLDKESDTITLTDNFTISGGSAYLQLDNVHLYHYDRITGQKGQEIASSRYNIEYDQVSNRITIELEDELSCILEYQYDIFRTGSATVDIDNSVSFSGTVVASKKLQDVIHTGWVQTRSLKLLKIDEDINSKYLVGAEFELYYYDTNDKKFKQMDTLGNNIINRDGHIVSDENGKINLTPLLGGEYEDKLFMLIEVKAPQGYSVNPEPTYFMICQTYDKNHIYYNMLDYTYRENKWQLEDGGALYDPIKQDDIVAFNSQGGGTVYVTNKSDMISLQKVWIDSDKYDLTNTPQSIRLQLSKQTEGASDSQTITIELTESSGSELENAKKWYTDSNINEQLENFISGDAKNTAYTVTETEIYVDGKWKTVEDAGFTVSYRNNGIQHGDITIVNEKQPEPYTLPETGGIGTTGYLAGGAILMMSSCLFGGYRMRRKRERRGR